MSNLTVFSLWTSIACLQHKCTHALSPTLCAPLPSLLCLPLSQPNASVFTTTHPSELGQHVKQRYYLSFSLFLAFTHTHTHTNSHTHFYSSLSLLLEAYDKPAKCGFVLNLISDVCSTMFCIMFADSR